ncbi:hypothetical protein FOMPIDRAFT_1024000 [Fomitopsis schrenkii]|uniref:Uncharacterized protein n=1 Tax=Fomitopsis schrenkii TaxID=2126942 RepID=S8FE92_FOMSC|nr:hypothetical protein FOMPIDRAFT_1024000 [Fomitopsis schrenkii]
MGFAGYDTAFSDSGRARRYRRTVHLHGHSPVASQTNIQPALEDKFPSAESCLPT